VAAFSHQFDMSALLDDDAFIEYQNSIGILDGEEAMGDSHRAAIAPNLLQIILNNPLGFGV
jgi:hypothetical protein